MTFFNKKEEVLDIKLTQFGKHLLSKGRFKPYYYAFFDDDIIYDHKFAGITETQNDIEDRIKETPRLKTQHVYKGIETEISKNLLDIRKDAVQDDSLDRNLPVLTTLQSTADKHYSNSIPMGSAQVGSSESPSWKVAYLKGELSGSVVIQANSDQPFLNIPQLDTEVLYRTSVRADSGLVEDQRAFDFYEDGTFVHLEDGSIILEVSEENGLLMNSSFDLEVFKVEKEQINGKITDREILTPLNFLSSMQKKYEIDSNNIYTPKNIALRPVDAPDQTNVEYFLEMNFDNGIDTATLCKYKPADKTQGLFSSRFYDCEDFTEDNKRDNIYDFDEIYEDPCE